MSGNGLMKDLNAGKNEGQERASKKVYEYD